MTALGPIPSWVPYGVTVLFLALWVPQIVSRRKNRKVLLHGSLTLVFWLAVMVLPGLVAVPKWLLWVFLAGLVISGLRAAMGLPESRRSQ